MVPIWVRSSSTMRVMVVEQTRAAIKKKKMGKMVDSRCTMVESLSKVTYPLLLSLRLST